ncbi:hypothetical protein [Streptomyces sp. NK08204]|uniref:hypothetical protein n=1 Tax=Streptomyces sp. NK08204 TaxID=2873260 RepID=UPI001CEC1155|nr:hypothetical protein [Streptomyces sp. NK08204]
MLRILDARTGESVAAAPVRRGLTRIEAHACGLDPTSLRVLLTADVLGRALELGGTPVWTTLTAACDRPALRTAATTLSVRPFEDGHDLASGLGEAQVVHVAPQGAEDTCGEGAVVSVAPVEWPRREPPGGAAEAPDGAAGGPGGAGRGPDQGAGGPDRTADGPDAMDRRPGGLEHGPGGLDRGPGGSRRAEDGGGRVADAPAGAAARTTPLPPSRPAPRPLPPLPALLAGADMDSAALRLALLSVPRREPVRMDGALLESAARSLGRWRRDVAGWARQPSRPVPDEVRARLRAAWEDDLDVPAVFGVLRDVASGPGVPDGARFETYAYADRLLALDLARDLGSLA